MLNCKVIVFIVHIRLSSYTIHFNLNYVVIDYDFGFHIFVT